MMQTRPEKTTIIMLPCAGTANVGQLTRRAVQDLVLEGKGAWVKCGQDAVILEKGVVTTGTPPFIVVDGCEQQCGRKRLEALDYDFEFHLCLADLGIEKTDSPEINYDELQLVKDAIIAESTRLTEVHPVIVGGCCCC